jgi:hypothetical protein
MQAHIQVMTTYHLTQSIITYLSPPSAKPRTVANTKMTQNSETADMSIRSEANGRPSQGQAKSTRRKNLWGYYVDETAEEKAQRWRAPDEVTNKVTRDLSSYTTYEKYLLDEMGAESPEENAEMKEAKDTIKTELLKAETDSAKAARDAREEQAQKARHTENEMEACGKDVVLVRESLQMNSTSRVAEGEGNVTTENEDTHAYEEKKR